VATAEFNGARIHVATGSVVAFQGDCIVNAANERGVGGGGVDGAINRAGGEEMINARQALPLVSPGVRIPSGEVRVTPAFGTLKCKHVIHACSADYNERPAGEADFIVRSAYKNALAAAVKLQATSIGFSLLSAGIYRGTQTLDHVLEQGFEAIKGNISPGQQVFLVAFTDEERDSLRALLRKYFPSTLNSSTGEKQPNDNQSRI